MGKYWGYSFPTLLRGAIFATIMAKEILLYSSMYSWSVTEIIAALNIHADEEVTIRVNSPGGNVFDSWGLFAKMKEHGNVTVKVDGLAASSAFNLLLYAKNVEALDVSTIMLHRADAYAETDEQKQMLAKINKDLRTKLEARVDADSFKKVTGYTMDDMFNPETRVNIWLTSKQAKELGIVSKIVKLKPEEQQAMAEAMAHWTLEVAAEHNPTEKNSNPTNMTLAKLKAEHPGVYQEVLAEVSKSIAEAATKKEQTRVKAWLAYVQIDAAAVLKGINEGIEVDAAVMAEMQVKAFSKNGLKSLETDSPETTATPAAEAPVAPEAKKEKDKAVDKFIEDAKALALGVQPKAAAVPAVK